MVESDEIQRRKVNRVRFMHALYDGTEGNTSVAIDSSMLGAELDINEIEADTIVTYLQNEGLLRVVGVSGLSSAIMLTHQGVVEVEQSKEEPEGATEHFPPLQQVINIYGDVAGSRIGQAGRDADQANEHDR